MAEQGEAGGQTADGRTAAGVRAAGALLWRPAGRGAQVAIVHRPRYDDWSFPKGKVRPGEHVLLTAVREVAEETGLRVTLGRRLPAAHYCARGEPKRVDYWLASAASAAAAEFTASAEIDQLAWLPAARAGGRLSYPHDVQLLAEFRDGPRRTTPMILARHASAGSKSAGLDEDGSRPLDARGEREAAILAALLSCFGDCRVLTSPTERCVATVRPYAARVGVPVEVVADLDIANAAAGERRLARAAARLAADERPVLVCAHRENLPTLIAAACRQLGAVTPDSKPLGKGEFMVLHRAAGKLAGVERHHALDAGWLGAD